MRRSFVPNIFTMSNLGLGFLAILFAAKGDPESIAIAGILVFAAAFFDVFDGHVARALDVVSPIGQQLDSLADEISYGIAPGVIAYQAYLCKLPEIGLGINWGMIIALIFPFFATFRLARFNIDEDEDGAFNGLPSPGAGIIVSVIPSLHLTDMPFWGIIDIQVPLEVFVPFYIFIGFLMVSKIDYNKLFADLMNKGMKVTIITVVVITLLLIFFRMWSVFGVTALYITVGLINFVIKLIKK